MGCPSCNVLTSNYMCYLSWMNIVQELIVMGIL